VAQKTRSVLAGLGILVFIVSAPRDLCPPCIVHRSLRTTKRTFANALWLFIIGCCSSSFFFPPLSSLPCTRRGAKGVRLAGLVAVCILARYGFIIVSSLVSVRCEYDAHSPVCHAEVYSPSAVGRPGRYRSLYQILSNSLWRIGMPDVYSLVPFSVGSVGGRRFTVHLFAPTRA